MEDNGAVYKVWLSSIGGLIIGALSLMSGLAWQHALGIRSPGFAWKIAGLGSLWGMTVVQLTPTGGVILENKTTVNYAVVALHAWISVLSSIVALIVWLGRTRAPGSR